LVLGPVTVDAQIAVDRFAAAECVRVQVADQSGMVDVFFVFRNRRQGVQVSRRLELSSPLRPLLGDLDQVANQIQELLTICQADDQSRRHDRYGTGDLFIDLILGNGDQSVVLRRIAEHKYFGLILGQQSGNRLAVVRDDDDRLEALRNGLGRQQHRFYQVHVVHFRSGPSQIGAQRRRLRVQAVTAAARQVRLVEQDRSAVNVALLSCRLRQSGGRFLQQLLFQRKRRPVRGRGHAACQDERQQQAKHYGRESGGGPNAACPGSVARRCTPHFESFCQ